MAKHPITKYSLANDVLHVHELFFSADNENYQAPETAREAMKQILEHMKKVGF